MKTISVLVRFGIYPAVYFGGTGAIIFLVSSGANTWLTLPLIVVACATLVSLGEYIQPHFADWRPSKTELKVDLVHYAVNYGIKQFTVLLLPIALGLIPVASTIWPSRWPFLFQVITAALVFDFVLYWIHRLSHRENFLWSLHTIHHNPDKLYVVNGERRHPLHQIVEGIPALGALVLLGVPHPVVVALLSFMNLNMLVQHANIDYRIGPLKYLVVAAETHRYHHFLEAGSTRKTVNFALIFALWDVIFGTFHFARPGLAHDQVGIRRLPRFPRQYLDHLKWPFSETLRIQYLRPQNDA